MPARERRYWLFKSDPDDFGWADLQAAKGQRTFWDGIRNYQARNLLRDEVHKGDGVLFYHSSSTPAGVVGIAEVVKEAGPDPTQFERGHAHHDPHSERADPRWVGVEIRALRALPKPVELAALKANARLAGMLVVQRGQRLSIQPVTRAEWEEVLRMGGLGGEF